jgi:hypothetical protein
LPVAAADAIEGVVVCLVLLLLLLLLPLRKAFEYWRRGQDSNLQGLSPGGFQDRFLTIRIPLLEFIDRGV